MDFTREPIIETVITPREGCKLVVRSSKGVGQEDYFVDAVEVVSFGHSFFFRSQERPKSFLVPVSDYEILELKETRMVLKNAATDRSIKIGGGKEAAPPRPPREEAEPRPQQELRGDRRRDGRRRRGRRGRDRPEQEMREEPLEQELPEHPEGFQPEAEEKAPSFISKLFPPPPTLINKESLGRYKPTEEPLAEDSEGPAPTEQETDDESEE